MDASANGLSGGNVAATAAAPPAPTLPGQAAPAAPPTADARLARRAASREAFLAGDKPPPAKAAEPADKPEAPAEEVAAPELDADDEGDTLDTSTAAPAAPAEVDKAKAEPADKDLQKRLDAVLKAERKAKAAVEEHRARVEAEVERKVRDFERRQTELAPKLDAYEKARARVAIDPIGVLESLGYPTEELAYLSRQAYGRSPEGVKNPQYRDAAERAMRERETAQSSTAVAQELRELKASLEAEKRAAAAEREAASFIDGVRGAVGADAPRTKALLERNQQRALRQLSVAAQRLIAETGEVPDHADVVRAVEDELAELLPDFEAPKPKPKTIPADETKTAPTLSSDLGTPTQPRTKRMSREDRRRDVIAGLERGGRAE